VKHPFLRTILLAALAICAAGLASAQTPQAATPSQADVDKAIAQLRADAAKDVNAIIGASMNFTSDEAAKFWPLYKPYETQRKALMDERLAIIKEYAANYTTMSDAKAAELAQRALALEEKGAAAKRSFMAELQKVLPGKTVARFYQVNTRIDLLRDLWFARDVPLVQ